MTQRIVVESITRIEGHLRLEVEVKDGRVVDAYSSGTMVRGFEIILRGRDPRAAWAFAERACGVCTTVHALASVRTVEDALEITVPPNAELIRNLMFCAQYMQDHVVHFYHLHALDWVDVVSALKADPRKTSEIAQSISNWPRSSPKYFSDVQKRLTAFVNSGQLGIFAKGYWGHPAYKLPPEVNLLGTAHYLEALEWQKETVKIHTIFGGKNPHPNYLAYGDLPGEGYGDPSKFKFPRGAILNRNLNEVIPVDGKDSEQVQEFITHSWYEYSDGDQAGKHPWLGETQLKYSGPKPPYDFLDVGEEVQLAKDAPVEGTSCGGGTLGSTSGCLCFRSRGSQGRGQWSAEAVRRAGHCIVFYFREDRSTRSGNKAGGPLGQGVLWRTAHPHQEWRHTRTFNNEKWNPETWPSEAKGVGLTEAPRGALAHWIVIKDKKITNYQLVVPSTWNASPRDSQNQMSAYEASLIGTPVANPEQPLELLRTVHSFDPCSACAVHLYDEKQRYVHHINTA